MIYLTTTIISTLHSAISWNDRNPLPLLVGECTKKLHMIWGLQFCCKCLASIASFMPVISPVLFWNGFHVPGLHACLSNYGASLYDQTDFTKTDASPSSPSSPTVQLPKSGTIHDARLRSWLQRRRKTLEEKPGKPSTSNSERLVAVHRGSHALHLPFKWVPIQARELASNDVYFRGIHVNSLSLILKPGPDVDWKIMEMKSTGCQELGAIHCCIIGNTMIFCRGLVQCDESKKANPRILQLPPSMCPNGILTFAVLCSQREDESQDASTFLSLGRNEGVPRWLDLHWERSS